MKYTFDISQSDGYVLALLTGDLTIRNASSIAEDFRKVAGLNVAIEVQNPTDLDLSFIQLLVHTIYTLSQQGVRASIKVSVKDADINLLKNTGFTQLLQLAANNA
ncbi:hypothetical protein WBG78_14170 [Chryseolinea sp. T2]|uniref:hypothetical protein n=1 Tax=Chryseolinea sp. T2 TaxID=3129255 RepID=UPI003077F8F5